jgi:23S rRNA (uracil1939-C5)-methyltransferase
MSSGRGVTEIVRIARLGSRGEGVAATARGLAYVAGALPGETVEIEGAGERAALLRIVEPSPERIGAICPLFGSCGGCAVQTLAGAPYAQWKRGLVVTALAQAGFADAEDRVGALVEAHGAGRRRVTLHVRAHGHGEGLRVIAGFARARSHEIIDIAACPLLAPGLADAFDIAREIGRALAALGKPLDVQATATDGGLDVDLRGAGAIDEALRQALVALAQAEDLARLSLHGVTLSERRPPRLAMGRALVIPPAGGFLQATAAGEAALATRVLDALAGARRIADLFCGCGPFALRLADHAEVTAIDSDAAAIAALDRAARGLGSGRIAAQRRDLFRRPLDVAELQGFDGAVLDPPRAGAREQARMLAASDVERVVAVSCAPGSFARDARLLVEGGYTLESVTPVDQFRFSAHVELVALFRKPKKAGKKRGLLSR